MNRIAESCGRSARLLLASGLACLAVAAAEAPAALALPALPVDAPQVALPGLLPSFLGQLPSLGPAPNGQKVLVLVDLRLRHERALARFVRRVSNPRSASYRHYLTPAQFRDRFAPSARAVSAARAFARQSGFRVAEVPSNHHYVALTGTVATAESAFQTRLEQFRVDGTLVHAPVVPPSIPASLRRYVSNVSGLDTADQMRPLSAPAASPPPAFVGAPPCSSTFGEQLASGTPPAYGVTQPWVTCGYTPAQIQGAYGTSEALNRGVDGRGQTVAIIDAYDSPTIAADANTYSQRHGLPRADITRVASPLATYSPEIPGTFVDPQGWSGEQTLDVEAVHSMAPGAKIVYEGANSPLNISLSMALNDVVNNARAQIVSNSYGSAGDFDNSSDNDPILQQAAAEGIGVYFSSGDSGDETKNPNGPGDREVDAPANDPLVTAVGGTSLAVKPGNGYGFETYWGTSSSSLSGGAWSPAPPGAYLYGGGGGVSQTYAEPSWQQGIVPASIANYFAGKPAQADAGDANGAVHSPGRAVPDVSMVGDPNTGFLVGQTQDFSSPALGLPTDDNHYSEYRIGGTSLSCPLFAGVMALADQASGKPHGFANPALYAIYRQGAYRDVSQPPHPVAVVRNTFTNGLDPSGGVVTSLRTTNVLNTLHSQSGYDDSTGLGSPRGMAFLRALAPSSALLRRAHRPHRR